MAIQLHLHLLHEQSWYNAVSAQRLHWQLTQVHLVCKIDVGVQNGCVQWKLNTLCSMIVMQRSL